MSWSTMRARQDAGRFISGTGDGDGSGPTNGCAVRASTNRPDDLAFFGLLGEPAATAWEELAGLGLVRNSGSMSSKRLM
jgi:hypothetical protein